MHLIHQPFKANLGDELKACLNSDFTHFYFSVAYAKTSGTDQLLPFLDQFRLNGGNITGTVGIDQKNTTAEALIDLLDHTDSLYLFHNCSFSTTYHPKFYFFKNETHAVLFVGSNNLTAGGLYTNYELSSKTVLDLSCPNDYSYCLEICNIINSYVDISSPFCIAADVILVNDLLKHNIIASESNNSTRSSAIASSVTASSLPFGSMHISAPSLQKNSSIKDFVNTSNDSIYANDITPYTPSISEKESLLVNEEPYIENEEPRPAETNLTSPIILQYTHFWKKLSNWDVSSNGPGQIQIPKSLYNHFTPFTRPYTTPSGAIQSENHFIVLFKSYGSQDKIADDARAILYQPAPTHKRSNNELRFTFRNTEISHSLSAGDILIFEHSNIPQYNFIVTHILSSSPDAANFPSKFGEF